MTMRQPQQMQPPRGRRGPPNRPDIGMSRGSPQFNDAVNMENNFTSVRPEKSSRPKRPEMKGPENINDILAGLKTKKIIRVQFTFHYLAVWQLFYYLYFCGFL